MTGSEGSLRDMSGVLMDRPGVLMALMDGDRVVMPKSMLIIENVSSISMVEVNEAISTREVGTEIEGG